MKQLFAAVSRIITLMISSNMKPVGIIVLGGTPSLRSGAARILTGVFGQRQQPVVLIPEDLKKQDPPISYPISFIGGTIYIPSDEFASRLREEAGVVIYEIRLSSLPAWLLRVLKWFGLYYSAVPIGELVEAGVPK